MEENKGKSQADILIEKLDALCIKNGLPKRETVSGTGHFIIISPKQTKNPKKK